MFNSETSVPATTDSLETQQEAKADLIDKLTPNDLVIGILAEVLIIAMETECAVIPWAMFNAFLWLGSISVAIGILCNVIKYLVTKILSDQMVDKPELHILKLLRCIKRIIPIGEIAVIAFSSTFLPRLEKTLEDMWNKFVSGEAADKNYGLLLEDKHYCVSIAVRIPLIFTAVSWVFLVFQSIAFVVIKR